MPAFIDSMTVPRGIDLRRWIPRPPEDKALNSCVLLGSFKFFPEILATIDEFERYGTMVLAPKRSEIHEGSGDFQLLRSDEEIRQQLEREYGSFNERQFAAIIEAIFTRTIDQAGFIYIVNPTGYAGESVAGEIGIALAAGKPVYAKYPMDPALDSNEGISGSPLWEGVAQMIEVYSPEQLVSTLEASGELPKAPNFW